MIPVEEALRIILERTPDLGTETVGLAEAHGRVLREEIRADRDLPPFDRAAVDGFAVRAASLGSGEPLRIVDQIAAGSAPRIPVGPGEAAAIMTGAPLPPGADAAILVEDTLTQNGFVSWPAPQRTPAPVSPGHRVTARGAEVRAGSLLLKPGGRLSAAGIGLLATVGKIRLAVGRRPRTSVLSTGDELTHPRTGAPPPGRIRDANSHLLAARCRALGLQARRLGFVRDDPDRIAARIAEGLRAEVLLISGGVSMGQRDFVEPVLEAAGVRLVVTSVAIRPGKPFVFGVAEKTGALVFGLPGNPVSAFTTLEVLVRPAFDRFEGTRESERPEVSVRLLAPVTNPGSRRAFLPARVGTDERGELRARPVRSQGSGDIAALALANALLVVPEDVDAVAAGATLRARPLPGFPDAGAGWHDFRR